MSINIAVFGAAGSIGRNTLNVIAQNSDQFNVVALTANTNVADMAMLCQKFSPQYAVMQDEKAAQLLSQQLKNNKCNTQVLAGSQAAQDVAASSEVDTVMAAIVGAAGLPPTLAAIKAGKRVLLANKESLVMAGEFMMQAVREHQAELIPVDSEHSALFQCMPAGTTCGVSVAKHISSIVLTASGGPFRTLPLQQLSSVTPEQAVMHPNWTMGPKVSVDSATMMNKGLEVIEAYWLFGVAQEQIKVLIHPQSIVHSLVQYRDGSTLAQLGYPDMRTPIACALAWPARINAGVAHLDLAKLAQLDFAPVDMARYPCLSLVFEALRTGGTAMAVLNAANEVAVSAFLQGEITYLDIYRVVSEVLSALPSATCDSLTTIFEADKRAREIANNEINKTHII